MKYIEPSAHNISPGANPKEISCSQRGDSTPYARDRNIQSKRMISSHEAAITLLIWGQQYVPYLVFYPGTRSDDFCILERSMHLRLARPSSDPSRRGLALGRLDWADRYAGTLEENNTGSTRTFQGWHVNQGALLSDDGTRACPTTPKARSTKVPTINIQSHQ